VNVGQENNAAMIIKCYVSLKFIIMIDDMFVNSLPREFQINAEEIRKSKMLLVGTDNNSWSKIW